MNFTTTIDSLKDGRVSDLCVKANLTIDKDNNVIGFEVIPPLTARQHILNVRGCMACHKATLEKGPHAIDLMCVPHYLEYQGLSDDVINELNAIRLRGCWNYYYYNRKENPPEYQAYRVRKAIEMSRVAE